MNDAVIKTFPLAMIGAVLLLFVIAGLLYKTRGASEYGIQGRFTGRIGEGAAIASNWMSGASFLGIAAIVYLHGYFALAYVIGWTGGYVLLLLLLAGQLRRFGKYTAPDFIGERYESPTARLLSAIISIIITIIYTTAQFKGIGILFSWLLGIDYTAGLITGSILLMSYIVLSGMLGVERSQKLQYFVLIVSFIIPLMLIAKKLGYFWVLPQFGYGKGIEELSTRFGVHMTSPFSRYGLFEWTALSFTLMVGTAGLPHVLSRFYTVNNVRDARWSVVWGLFFISLIYWSAPAYAVFSKLFEIRGGIVLPPEAAESIADITVLRAAVHAGIPEWAVGLLAAGAVSATFFTASALLMNGAASASYDIYHRIINPNASQTARLNVAKFSTLLLAVTVFLAALNPFALIAEIAAVAFALAGNTIFPAFLLGIWWDKTNRHGVISGMLTGLAITFAQPLAGHFFPIINTILPMTSSALLGVPIVIAVIIAVSLVTPPPSEEVRRFLAEEVHGEIR